MPTEPRNLSPTSTVPLWVRGAWRRTLLEWDDGEDRSTDVLWLQTSLLFADLRIPATDAGSAEGFAGHLSVEGQICRWHRPIDIRPRGGDGDVGVVYRRGGRMIECGVHRNYLEEWQQVDPGEPCFAASRGDVRIAADKIVWAPQGPVEIVVAVGSHMIHAWRGREGAGLAHFRLDDRYRLSRGNAAGTHGPDPAPANWRIWEDTTGAAAEPILAQV